MPRGLLDSATPLLAIVALCAVAAGLRMTPPVPETVPAPVAAPAPPSVEGFTCVKPLVNPPRLQALIVGDSNIFGPFGRFLERSLGALGYDVVRRGKPVSGLSRPDFFDWDQEAMALLEAQDPDLVIAMFGGNDGQWLGFKHRSITSTRPSDGEGWQREYGQRVRAFATRLRGEDRRVFFLSPTNRAPRLARELMRRVRRAQREGLAGLARVTWIDMFPYTSDDAGEWLKSGVDVDGHPVNYRRPDGIHLTPAGGKLVGQRVLDRLMDDGLTSCAARE